MSDLSDADHEREQARLLDNFAVRDLDSDYSGSASDLDTSSGESDDGVPVQQHGLNIDSGASPDDSDIDRSADESAADDAAVPQIIQYRLGRLPTWKCLHKGRVIGQSFQRHSGPAAIHSNKPRAITIKQ